jgi:hypothetical protein
VSLSLCSGHMSMRILLEGVMKALKDTLVCLLCNFRYELPAPSSGQKNDITAWQECVNNSMAQLEHQAVRIENLELMSQHGCNAWKVYNE